MLNIRKWNYCSRRYSSSNYGAHSIAVRIGDLTLYWSYDTIMAFELGGKLYVSENDWGPTTGKHLNEICSDKTRRIKREVFEKLLQAALDSFSLEKGE